MATPNNNAWSAPSPQASAQPAGGEDYGLQARPMGLKVHYTFDRENQIHCLARWPHILQVQTMPLDERTTIGVVDLRTCLQAVAQCSPEIVDQHDTDYSIYATDYSEMNWPLVGQGMLSWGLDQNGSQQQQEQLVTGRVTRNIMAILGNGSRDTLEVKLKLTAVPKMHPRSDFPSMDSLDMSKFAPTPTDTNSEWNSFIQSNPLLGHSANVASMPSPALPSTQLSQPNGHHNADERRFLESRHESAPPQPPRPASIPPQNVTRQPSVPLANIAPSPASLQRVASPALAPRPPGVVELPPTRPSSRPTSRASKSRSRQPTGRPRGRPRKKPQETGNTSAAEEATDGDEGPQKKRAKVTKTEYNMIAPFGSGPESLRVTASISGSLRSMRPVGLGDTAVANHLQDVPRAPTPVPDVPLMHKQQLRMRVLESKAKLEPLGEPEAAAGYQRRLSQQEIHAGSSQDVRSPDSTALSPDQTYSPEDSPADLGSSPPVPRTTAYIPTSPMASSPILPAMRMRQVDSGFMSGGIDDLFDEDDLQELPLAKSEAMPRESQDRPVQALPPPVLSRLNNGKACHSQERQLPNFPFHEVQPGPPELLPTTSIFNPVGKVKSLNRPPVTVAPKKPTAPSLKRSNTAPSAVTEPAPIPQEEPASQQAVEPSPGPYDHQSQGFPAQLDQHREASPSNLEAVLHQALSNEVGSDANGVRPMRPEPSAPMADMMPIPERPEPTELPLTLPTKSTSRPASRLVSRPASRGPSVPTVPASDPVAESVLTMPHPFMSEAPFPLDDDTPRYSKNQVKKQSIKERLETAIQKGESPPFCANCGAIETPTWRKIWTQEQLGEPGKHQFSDKPGSVTAVDVLEQDPDGQILAHRLVKKHLGPTEDRKCWTESLLCNPCGIWLAKFKGQRPPERWDKDAARLGQPRRKRDNKNGNGKGKKPRSKSDAQLNPTSEAYFTTDPLGPADLDSPKEKPYGMESFSGNDKMQDSETGDQYSSKDLNLRSSPKHGGPGSTHSRGSGTADSPIAIEDDLGTTRRLLFPSPRKDGLPKVLGELTPNHAQMNMNPQEVKSAATGKENAKSSQIRPGTPAHGDHDDLDQELFGTPPDRPTTPLGRSELSGVFKTPTRPTPSHRPITRSISRSIRTVRSIAKSPGNVFGQLLRTPSKTPRSSASTAIALSTGKRRSPRNAHLHAHFSLDDMHFDSPFTATLNQLLSEANDFTSGSPSHGLVDLDLSGLPNLPSDLDTQHLTSANAIDFGNFLSTDLIMPSSPPLLRNHHGGSLNFAASLSAGDIWAQLEKSGLSEMEGVEMSEPN